MDRTLNFIVFFVCVFLLILSAWLCYRIVEEQRASDAYVERYVSWLNAAQEMHNASEFLTFQARQYALSLNPSHIHKYLSEVYNNRSRENSLKILYDTNADKPAGSEHLVTALENSVILAKKEQYALRLLAEASGTDLSDLQDLVKNAHLTSADRELDRDGRLKRARDLLFDSTYNQEQREILDPIHRFEEASNQAMLRARKEYSDHIGTLAMELQFSLALLFVCAVFFIARMQTQQVHF